MIHDISAAKARAASGHRKPGAQAGDPVILEQEASDRGLREQTVRLREARLAAEARDGRQRPPSGRKPPAAARVKRQGAEARGSVASPPREAA